MKKKIIITIIIALVVVATGIGTVVAYNAVTTNRTGLTLNLDFGNNDGISVIFDTSGTGANATTANSPTLTDDYVDLNGTTQNASAIGTGIFNTAQTSFAIKFSPDFAWDSGTDPIFFDSTNANRYILFKDPGNNNLVIWYNGASIGIFTAASYAPYWNVGGENTLIVSAESGSAKGWLNGYEVMAGASAFTPGNPAELFIGSRYNSIRFFDGKIHYLKVWDRLLTDSEVATLSADRTDHTQASPRNNLVGHWTLDSNDINGTTVYDKSEAGRDGVSNNTPSVVSGKINQAMDFNGSTDYIEVSDVDDFAWGEDGDFSISFWYKAETTYSALANFVDADNGAPRWEMGINSSNNVYAHAHDGVAGGNSVITPTVANPSDGQWHHVVGSYDRDGNLVLYLDVDTTASASMAAIDSLTVAGALSIGRNDAGNNYLRDPLDDVRIYSKALTANDVRNLYNATKRKYISAPPRNGLIGHWNMDTNDINGTTVYDKSGNGNDGTITGATSVEGKIKEALNFTTGGSNNVNFGNDAILNPSTQITVSAWVKPSILTGNQPLLFKSVNEYYIWLTVGGSIQMVTKGLSDEIMSISSSLLTLNDWNYLTFTYNGAIKKIYLNGTEITSENATGNITTGANDLILGYFGTAMGGVIDEVRIYNRALPTPEITTLYNATKLNYIR